MLKTLSPQVINPALSISALDLPELLTAARALPNLRYVLVDPVAITGDGHKNTEVRRSLQPLVDLAVELNVVLLGISHFTKGTAGRDPVERVIGSIAFGALARIVLAAAKVQEDESERRIFCRGKSNIGLDNGGWEYSLVLTDVPGFPEIAPVTRVLWGAALEGSARDLLAKAETSTDPNKRDAITEAADWLRSILGAGPMTSSQIKTAAEKEGIAWRTIGRAKKDIGIKTCRTGFGKDGDWRWELLSVLTAFEAGAQLDIDD